MPKVFYETGKYPACDKLKAEHRLPILREFMEWIQEVKKAELAVWHQHAPSCYDKATSGIEPRRVCGYRDEQLAPLNIKTQKLLYEYLELDETAIETETRQMLKDMYGGNDEG